MQNRLKIALMIAVFFGFIAAYGIYNFLGQRQKENESLRAADQEILVALVFWVAIKSTNIGDKLASGWSQVASCVTSPQACNSSS